MESLADFSRRFQVGTAASSRAGEYYRLAEVKGMLAVRGMSVSSLALICLEIACGQCGEPFDRVCTVTYLHTRPFLACIIVVGLEKRLQEKFWKAIILSRHHCAEASPEAVWPPAQGL